MESTILSDKSNPQPPYPRAKILPEHTAFIINFVDNYPICRVDGDTKILCEPFSGFVNIFFSREQAHKTPLCPVT